MKKIAPETERRMMDAISHTTDAVLAGEDPNKAIVKVAREMQLRPGELDLVVHAYNVGQTTHQRKSNEDLLQKRAEFPLADLQVVKHTLYPPQTKEASASVIDTVVSSEYNYSPRAMLQRRHRLMKKASLPEWSQLRDMLIKKAEDLPSEKNEFRPVLNEQRRLQWACDDARRKHASAFDELGSAFNDLTDYFRRPGAHPIPVVKEAVVLMHGNKGKRVMDELISVNPGLTKLSDHHLGHSVLSPGRHAFPVTVDDLDATEAPFTIVNRVLKAAEDVRIAAGELAEANKAAAAHQEHDLAPFVEPLVSPSILGSSSDEREKQSMDPFTTLIGASAATNLAEGLGKLGGPSEDERVSGALASLHDPEHEAQMRAINSQATLQDLMLNDEVISGYDAPEVTDAYNDLVQLSPNIAGQRMLVQSLLRKKLQQGALDTFEQDQILDADKKLRDQAALSQGSQHASII